MIRQTLERFLILFICIINFVPAQVEQPYPPLSLVSIPTAGTLPRGSFTLESLLTKSGGVTPRLSVGFTDNFSFGVSFGMQNLIGDNKPAVNKTTPEVQIKYRVFDESQTMPALVYGLDTQGRGIYHETDSILLSGEFDSLRTINRYDQKAWGMYMVMSKNWNLFGNLGLHLGFNKSLSENDDGDNDLNVFFGIDKELNRTFSLLVEYDSALNDNDYDLDEITFGRGKGYLNAGLRWAFNANLMVEINFNDINQNTSAKYTNREIKVMFSESF
ncbi:MAG: hypothetical protein QF472_00795 [Candidatus Marinimicrobia bacterium]|jgi:hypothetical protein|nr:hypothetical protein [Candidatus Neomarinimicrobiota bacterium]